MPNSDGGPGTTTTSIAQLLCVEFDIEYQVNVKNPKNVSVVPVKCQGEVVCDEGEQCPECPAVTNENCEDNC
ncbi:MAG: hypothetical protein ACQERJ_04010 [Bacillota bacterium]